MTPDSLTLLSLLTGASAAALLLAFVTFRSVRGAPETNSYAERPAALTLLFRDGVLTDAHDALWPLIADKTDAQGIWADIRSALLDLVPNLPDILPDGPTLLSDKGGPNVAVDIADGVHRVSILPDPHDPAAWFASRQAELRLAQVDPAIAACPNPIWALDQAGGYLWGNAAFTALSDTDTDPAALARHIADLLESPKRAPTPRIRLETDQTHPNRWFEVTTRTTVSGSLCFATGVDAVVRAEEAQRNFVQTLSKTFANLATGLAIFDRDRRLALFNPALIDLSGLSAEFLSGRPNLFQFFDKLREHEIMPEPKNYDHWRERMAKLVAAASDDRFHESWNLVSGQTFDVTGRPYPDGAIAFLFDDVSAEVSLTRTFRTQLDTFQSALDVMDDAVAIFDQKGTLTASNEAYRVMWSVDPDTSVNSTSIMDATQDWKTAFQPNPIWPDLREFVTNTVDRASWDSDLIAKDGAPVICRVDPVCYGSTLVRFSRITKPRSAPVDADPASVPISA